MKRGREPYPESKVPALSTSSQPWLLVECRLGPGGVQRRVISAWDSEERAIQFRNQAKGWRYYCLDFYVARNSSQLWEQLIGRPTRKR